jgi:hypothetical protein
MTLSTSSVAATPRSCGEIEELIGNVITDPGENRDKRFRQFRLDHGAFDPKTRRVFVAHTALNRVEVIGSRCRRHLATLDGFPRRQVSSPMKVKFCHQSGSASLACIDAKHWRRNLSQ